MKKTFIVVLIAAVVFSVACAYADDETGVTFDNVTFQKAYKIKGYASVTLLGFKFVNMYAQWDDGKASENKENASERSRNSEQYVFSQKTKDKRGDVHYSLPFINCHFVQSGNEAEYAWLKVDILNLQKISATFIKDIAVKVIYDDEYEYEGWVRQFNYDFSDSEIYKYKETIQLARVAYNLNKLRRF